MSDHTTDEVLHLLREIMHRADMRSRRLLREIGLSSTQAGVLRALADGTPKSAGVLARDLSLTGATLSGVLDRLQQRGLVERVRGEPDKRRVDVRILPAGRDRLDEIPRRFHDHFTQAFGTLAETDRHRILQALREVAGMFGGENAPTVPPLPFSPFPPETNSQTKVS